MRVRPANPDDAPAVTRAYLASWRAGYEGLLGDGELDVQAKTRAGYDWKAAMARAEGIVLVAEEGGEIVGVVECQWQPSPEQLPWLHMLYVVPEAWGRGAATGLLNEALAAAKSAGCQSIWLRVVEAQVRARHFYEREGWQLDEGFPPTTNGLFRLLHYRRDL